MEARPVRRLRRLFLRVVLGCLVVLVSVAGYLAVRPIPTPILRWVIVWSAPSLLTDHALDSPGGFSRVTRAVHRVWGNLLSFSLARAYDAAVPVDATKDDVSYLIDRLSPLRRRLVSQNELTHPTHDWLGFFAGAGYCDQLNRVGALVLTERFRRVQTFALWSPDRSGGHVVGRVWSDEVGDWLYFDLWPVNLTVFRFDHGVRPLGGTCDVAPADAPPGDALAAGLYPEIPSGTVLNEYTSTFGAYLWSRLRADRTTALSVADDFPRVASPAAVSPAATAVGTPAEAPVASFPTGDTSSVGRLVVTAAVARAFMTERLERLLGPVARVPRVPSTHPETEDDRLLISVSRIVAGKLTAPVISCARPQLGRAVPTGATRDGG